MQLCRRVPRWIRNLSKGETLQLAASEPARAPSDRGSGPVVVKAPNFPNMLLGGKLEKHIDHDKIVDIEPSVREHNQYINHDMEPDVHKHDQYTDHDKITDIDNLNIIDDDSALPPIPNTTLVWTSLSLGLGYRAAFGRPHPG